jgi:hypothetical protein
MARYFYLSIDTNKSIALFRETIPLKAKCVGRKLTLKSPAYEELLL